MHSKQNIFTLQRGFGQSLFKYSSSSLFWWFSFASCLYLLQFIWTSYSGWLLIKCLFQSTTYGINSHYWRIFANNLAAFAIFFCRFFVIKYACLCGSIDKHHFFKLFLLLISQSTPLSLLKNQSEQNAHIKQGKIYCMRYCCPAGFRVMKR